jgi:putative transposase
MMAFSGQEEAMKKARFSEEQMVRIQREVDAGTVADAARKHGISQVDDRPLARAVWAA